MKKLAISLAVLFVLCLSSAAKADTLTFTPNPADMGDLDHHDVYTWRVDNVNLHGQQITGARLTITNIANWNNTANTLFIHLLDSARNAGVASFQDEPADAVPVDHGIRRIAASYDRGAALAEARAFLTGRPYTPAAEAQRTLATHRHW